MPITYKNVISLDSNDANFRSIDSLYINAALARGAFERLLRRTSVGQQIELINLSGATQCLDKIRERACTHIYTPVRPSVGSRLFCLCAQSTRGCA